MTRYGIAFVALAGAAFLAGCTDTAENSRRLGSVEAKIKAVEDEKGSLAAETEKLRESSAQLNRILGRLETKLADADAKEASLRADVAKLREENESIRKEFASVKRAVAEGGGGGLVPQYPAKPILKLLGHTDSSVRSYASQILKKLADPESVDPLVEVATSRADANTRIYAIQALGAFKDKRVEKTLADLIKDPDANVRRAVYQAMGQVGTEAMLTPLLAALEREMKNPAQPGRSYNYDLQQIANALAGFRDVRAGRALLRVLQEGDKNTARYVAQAFYRYRNPKLVPDVVAFLKKSPDPAANDHNAPHGYLLQMLGQVGDESAAEVVLKYLGSANMSVRQSAAGALRKVAGKKSVPLLVKALETGKAPNGQPMQQTELTNIISALSQLGDPRAARALLSQVKNPNQSVAYQAASALSRCIDPEITTDLVKAWEACTNASVKNYLKAALSSGGYPVRWIEGDKTFVLDKERLEWLRKNMKKVTDDRPLKPGQERF